MIRKLVLWLVVFVAVALAATYLVRNYIVEAAVENGSTYAMGLNTELGSATLSLGAGSLELENYRVENPEGFKSDNIISIGSGTLDVDAGSIFDSMIVVDSLVLDDIQVNLEQIDTKGNYQALFENIRNADFGSESSAGDTRISFRKVSIRSIRVSATLHALGDNRFEKTLAVDNFTISNLGGTNGVTIGEAAARIVRDIIQRAALRGQADYPELFKGNVSDAIEKKTKAAEEAVTRQLQDVGKSLIGDGK